ncbi:MAG TPA: hypothetical protein VNV39_07185 [Stellaceae bacterium]|nr:hypothetical protein [Stellaceae bacterium]
MDFVSLVTIGDLVAKPLDLRGVGHVRDVGRDTQALRQARHLAQSQCFGHPGGGDVAHRDIAGFRRQLPDEFPPHPRAAAGDDCDPAREILHLFCLPCLAYRLAVCSGVIPSRRTLLLFI